MTHFQDIRIMELDTTASGPAENGPLMNMVLKLSAETPSDWRETFERTWKAGALAMRRNVALEGDTLTSTCMPYELQGQIDQLNDVMLATNESYKLTTQEAVARQEGELKDLKATLKYD